MGRKYAVSWEDTLRPESAPSTIDPRLQRSEHTWQIVYAEACAIPQSSLPVAVEVVAVEDGLEEQTANNQLTTTSGPHQAQQGSGSTVEADEGGPPQPWRHSNFLDLILGLSLSATSFLITVKLEIVGMTVYLIAAGLHKIVRRFLHSPVNIVPKSILVALIFIFLFIDTVLLATGVLTTEVLGGISRVLCTIFGSPRSGSEWRQFIRRTCHLTRWACRRFQRDWNPKRTFPFSFDSESGMISSNNDLDAGSTSRINEMELQEETQALRDSTNDIGTNPQTRDDDNNSQPPNHMDGKEPSNGLNLASRLNAPADIIQAVEIV